MENSSDEELVAVEAQEVAGSSSSDDEDVFRYGSTATPHSYLGEVDDVACNSVFLEEGSLLMLPIFYIEGIVLFPGATLPMRILDPGDKAAVDLAQSSAEAPSTLGVVHGRSRMSSRQLVVGTTAEIRQLRSVADGSVNLVAKGCQRFRTAHVWTNADGVVCAQVCILSEDLPLHIPRDAFGKLACVLSFQSGRDPSIILEQKREEPKHLRELNSVAHEATQCLRGAHHAGENWGIGVVQGEVEAQHYRPRQEKTDHRAAHARQTHDNDDYPIHDCSQREESSFDRRGGFRKRWALDASKCLSMPQCSAWPHWVYRMHDAYYLAQRAAARLEWLLASSNDGKIQLESIRVVGMDPKIMLKGFHAFNWRNLLTDGS
ncbi:hypothetical protein GOP47_0007317 [Adiantum capillus-veneris]|uniref:Lon N-terminal domain-containing protein n=1 Tax=Adiantum capillus-veneris TaxID=13818 RepID=A0A9D4V1C3_ADICA|nr:hypothetical protein GOP47_0007317 [Adiantum capillus-veneris]